MAKIIATPPPNGGDPVFRVSGSWYFWDETWSDNYGPFDTELAARSELQQYVLAQLGEPRPNRFFALLCFIGLHGNKNIWTSDGISSHTYHENCRRCGRRWLQEGFDP